MDKDMFDEELTQLTTRKGLFLKGGAAAAGLTVLGSPTAAAFAASKATIKVAVVTHGDTGSFWSVFKKGVDQAAKDLKSRGVSVTQVYANNDVAKQVAGINAAVAVGRKGDRDLGAGRQRTQGPAPKGLEQGDRDHHGQLRARGIRLAPDVHGPRRSDGRPSPDRARVSSSRRWDRRRS